MNNACARFNISGIPVSSSPPLEAPLGTTARSILDGARDDDDWRELLRGRVLRSGDAGRVDQWRARANLHAKPAWDISGGVKQTRALRRLVHPGGDFGTESHCECGGRSQMPARGCDKVHGDDDGCVHSGPRTRTAQGASGLLEGLRELFEVFSSHVSASKAVGQAVVSVPTWAETRAGAGVKRDAMA